MDRRQQLEALAADLRALVEVLARDPGCSWRQHLANCLSIADELLATGFTQDQLSQLSGSTTSIYGGAGSFNDYAPVTRIGATGVLQIIPGMEAVDTLAGNAYQSALTLRVVGEA